MKRLSQFRSGTFVVAALAAVSLAGGVAQGAAFVLDSTNAPGSINVFANDFEFGMAINGNPFQSGLFSPAQADFPGPGLTFNGHFIDNGTTPPLTRTVYFVDPLSPNVALDILTYNFTPAGDFFSVIMSGSFQADPSGLGPVPGGTNPADIWPVGVPFTWSTTGFGGVVITVPAPGAAGLLALGGLLAARRRRAR
ncbi:MAG: hypothetical protein H7210_06055 [Pyrinomonadaceae bacterium]|nr:hypothetical protein [Phycisphaerales bacterium]